VQPAPTPVPAVAQADKKDSPKKGDGKKGGGKQDHGVGEEPEVKGFMTLNEIALKTGVPKDYLLRALGLPANIDGRSPVRQWMHDHGKSIGDLREAVTQYRAGKR